MNFERYANLPFMFFEAARQHGEKPFLWSRRHRHYESVSWSVAAAQVETLADSLVAIGIQPNERVVLVSENRPEWVIADLAIMSAGAISVPAYTTNTIEDHRHILRNSGAAAAIVSTKALAERVIAAAQKEPGLRAIIVIEERPQAQDVAVHCYMQLLSRERTGEAQKRLAAVGPEDTACLIHTSGTGSSPKGVMLSHRNILSNCSSAYALLEPIGVARRSG